MDYWRILFFARLMTVLQTKIGAKNNMRQGLKDKWNAH